MKKKADGAFRTVKRRKNDAAKRGLILDVASKLFVERGVQQTTLDDIAQELGITKPALYYYFRNKDQIISECLALTSEAKSRNDAEVRESGKTGLEKLEAYMHYWEGFAKNQFMVSVDLNTLSEKNRRQHKQLQREVFATLHEIIDEGFRDGSIRKCDRNILTQAIIGALNSIVRWYDPEGPLTPAQVVTRMFDLFATGIAGQRKPKR